jgi:hypothetical protein
VCPRSPFLFSHFRFHEQTKPHRIKGVKAHPEVMTTAVVTGTPVSTTPTSSVYYVSASSGVHASYFVRSDGSVDRLKGGSVPSQRIPPPESTKYIAASAGLYASYLLREDGACDRLTGGSEFKMETIQPSGQGSMKDLFAGKLKYVAVSNSMGPCYLLRSDGKVDCVRSGEVNQTLESPYTQICGGTDCSYHLKKDGSVDKIWAKGVRCVSNQWPLGCTSRAAE